MSLEFLEQHIQRNPAQAALNMVVCMDGRGWRYGAYIHWPGGLQLGMGYAVLAKTKLPGDVVARNVLDASKQAGMHPYYHADTNHHKCGHVGKILTFAKKYKLDNHQAQAYFSTTEKYPGIYLEELEGEHEECGVVHNYDPVYTVLPKDNISRAWCKTPFELI